MIERPRQNPNHKYSSKKGGGVPKKCGFLEASSSFRSQSSVTRSRSIQTASNRNAGTVKSTATVTGTVTRPEIWRLLPLRNPFTGQWEPRLMVQTSDGHARHRPIGIVPDGLTSWKLKPHNTMVKRLAVHGSAPTNLWKTNNVKVLLVLAFIVTMAIIFLCIRLISDSKRRKGIGTQTDASAQKKS
ncbi:unnamed protein product [Fusarium venenatum]|uniref:Uncharacterized protein n=1 Tax=Fusarium venenatum TaxID=56646 RepID=A0A2L2TES1_9HYPO|nr:uncharacterized protein FVRRES_08665 [Fusarium venenatum]CEI68588.1 unnamed protein product [Fusarium venenatum]